MLVNFILAIVFIFSVVISYSMLFAAAQNDYQDEESADYFYRRDLGYSLLISIGMSFVVGPLSILFSWFISGFAEHGLKFK